MEQETTTYVETTDEEGMPWYFMVLIFGGVLGAIVGVFFLTRLLKAKYPSKPTTTATTTNIQGKNYFKIDENNFLKPNFSFLDRVEQGNATTSSAQNENPESSKGFYFSPLTMQMEFKDQRKKENIRSMRGFIT